MTEAQLALLSDTRLSARARFVGVFLSEIESPSEHGPEIPSDFFESFFGHSWDVLRRDVKALEKAGWIERKTQTGKGHSPAYRFLDHAKTPPYQDLRTAFLHTLSDSLGENVALKDFSLGGSVALNAPTSSSSKPLPLPPLDARAREFISESESLVGTRDTLIDYLVEKVDTRKQLAYSQTVAGIIEGSDERLWMARDGSHLKEGRAKIISGCLNELRQSDEIGKYFPGPPGDIRNLQSKIRYKVKAQTDAKRDADRNNARDSQSGDPGQSPTRDPERWKKGAVDGSFL